MARNEKRSSAILWRVGAITLMLVLASVSAIPAQAGVIRLQIDSREVVAEPNANPGIGPYERLAGTAYLVADPADPANARITDLELAPRNAQGMVEYSTEFELYRPVDLSRGNGRLLYFVNNRGNRHGSGFFSHGLDYNWLQSEGYSYLWCGWACDVENSERRLNIQVPAATGGEKPIQGRVYTQIVNYADQPVPSLPLTWGGSIAHPTVSLAGDGATLSRRRYPWDDPQQVACQEWSFARSVGGEIVPDPGYLYLENGFEPGWLYDLVYTSQDPPLTGLGLAAIRDLVSYFRFAQNDSFGVPNPPRPACGPRICLGSFPIRTAFAPFRVGGFQR